MRAQAALLPVTLLSCERVEQGRYRARWRLENRSSDSLSLLETWIPHEKFKGDRIVHAPALSLPPGGSSDIQQVVSFDPANAGLENSFVVLRLSGPGGEEPFRLFARLRVDVEGDRV